MKNHFFDLGFLGTFAALGSASALVLGCSSTPRQAASDDSDGLGASASQALTTWNGNVADHQCNVVMRQAYETYLGRSGPEADCSSGTCWVVVRGTVDVASSNVAAGASPPSIAWQGGDATWRNVTTSPIHGAGEGYRRYAFELRDHTFSNGQNAGAMQLVPYVALPSGVYYDHNKNQGDFDNFTLDVSNNWTLPLDTDTCRALAPAGEGTVSFDGTFHQSVQGALVQRGKLYVDYDIYRLPQCMSSYTHGFDAWATLAHVKFTPSNALTTLLVNGPKDSTGRYTALPLELDIPAATTGVEFWFSTSGEGCSTQWDSNYGDNFIFPVSSP